MTGIAAEYGGAGAFNFGGGTLQAASGFSTSVPIVLTTAGRSGVFDTNGDAITLAAPLTGPGGLTAAGSGVLTLAVSNGFTGTTLAANGTLVLDDSNSLSGSTFDTSGSGQLSFASGVYAFNFGGLQGSGSLALTDALQATNDIALSVGANNAGHDLFRQLDRQ